MSTVYQCCKKYKDVNKTLIILYHADTEKEAIEWLENNGGGIYKNILHNFKVSIKGKDLICQQKRL